MLWKPFTFKGQTYDLSHLHPLEYEFVIPAKDGKPEQKIPVRVEFSLHCFTRGLKDGEKPAHDETYSDSRETRVFLPSRHRLSLSLPNILRNLGARKCFHTGHHNFFTVDLRDEDGKIVHYEIFFKPSRGQQKKLLIYVQSAYVRDDSGIPLSKPHPGKPIKFAVIAHNTMTNKLIKTPPK